MGEKLLLVDGHSIMARAFYALPLLTNSNEEYTNAIYGFLNMFFKFVDEEKPTSIAVAFDMSAPTFRHQAFACYKGTRKDMPNELLAQVQPMQNLLRLMNISVVTLNGYEADDILGTLAVRAEASGYDVVILSGDRDLLQLATDHVKIRIPKTKRGKTEVEDYFAVDVLNKIGVTPQEYIEVKALMGDTSDNIPGVPGIGEKTAVKIISEYKSVKNAIERAANIKPAKAAQNLLDNEALAHLSLKLARIITDAPLEQLPLNPPDMFNENAYAEARRLELKSLYHFFSQKESDVPVTASAPCLILSTQDDLVGFKSFIHELPVDEDADKSVDSQTNSDVRTLTQAVTSLKSIYEQARYLSLSNAPEHAAAYQIICNEKTGEFVCVSLSLAFANNAALSCFARTGDKLSAGDIVNWLRDVLDILNKKAKVVTIDIKKQIVRLANLGMDIADYQRLIHDIMLAAYVLNPSSDSDDYSNIALDYLKESRASSFGFWKSKEELTDERLREFACQQTEVVRRAWPIVRQQLIENNQWDLYNDIEQPLARVLADMEIRGIGVNTQTLEDFGELMNERIYTLTEGIYSNAMVKFNINSTRELGEVLFEQLGLRGGKKTKTGYSTAVDVLEKLKGKHPIIDKILDYRMVTKLKSTYVDGLLAVARDNKIHSTFNQTVASTGRLSSSNPNLQNIPIRTEMGRLLRKAFIPRSGCAFIDGDYSQIELRVLAHMSGDEELINAFKSGLDIHRLTASQVFHTNFDDVTPFMRSAAKAVNFGIIYGQSAFGLAQGLDIGAKEADEYIKNYLARYPKIKTFFNDLISSAKAKGYAETLYGRRRKIPELTHSNFNMRSFGERAAMNMPIQGTAADIIKIAMIRTDARIKREKLGARLILQVHDELLLEAPNGEIERTRRVLTEEMEHAADLDVPLVVDAHVGETWYDTK